MAILMPGSNVTAERIAAKTPACPGLLVGLSAISAVVLITLLSAGTCIAQDQEPSGADRSLAQVAREKSSRKAKTVITDDDMPSHPQPAPAAPTSGRAESAGSDKDGTSKKEESAKQPPSPTSAPRTLSQPVELDEARQLVEQLKQQEQMLIQSYDEIARKLAEADSDSRRRMFSESLANRDVSLARKRKQIEEAERALQGIEKVGLPQGETTNEAK
jgi:hypothetical protein